MSRTITRSRAAGSVALLLSTAAAAMQRQRQRHLLSVCRRELDDELPESNEFEKRYLIDPQHQLLYCQVSKAACTSWSYLLYEANLGYRPYVKGQQVHSKEIRRSASVFLKHKLDLRLHGHFTKFLIMRHPLSRLLSAYRNIVEYNGGPGPGRRVVKIITSRYRTTRKQLTLAQFIEFVTSTSDDGVKQRVTFDRHWTSYARACELCAIEYDYMIYFENMEVESGPILRQLGWPEDYFVKADRVNSYDDVKNATVLPFAPRKLSEYENINKTLLAKLIAHYELDMKLFGYTFDSNTYMAGFENDVIPFSKV